MPIKKTIVSVIIPVHDRPDLANTAISSVRNQTGVLSIQIIVVDDSVNGLRRELKLGKDALYIRNKLKHHPGVARNLGLKHATGSFISFLDADDFYEPDFLVSGAKVLSDNPTASSVVCLSTKVFQDRISPITRYKLILFNAVKEILLFLNWVFGGHLHPQWVYLLQLSHQLFKSSSLRGISFDMKTPFCEDWYFSLAVLKKGVCVIIPKRLTNYRYSQTSNTFVNSTKIKNKANTYEKFHKFLTSHYPKTLGELLFNLYYRNILIKNA